MSLDDLIPILFVAFFVVNAFLRGGRRSRRSKGQGKASGKGQSTQTRTPGSSPTTGGGQSGESSTPTTSPERSFSDDLAERLEEARRRVQQAGRGDASSSTSASSTSTSSTSTSPSMTSASGSSIGGSGSRSISGVGSSPSSPAPQPPPSFLGREGRPTIEHRMSSQATQDGSLGREGRPPRRPSKRTPVVATPTSADGSATLRAAGTIGFEPNDLVRGVIWSEVLGPPISARTWRRPASRRPSR